MIYGIAAFACFFISYLVGWPGIAVWLEHGSDTNMLKALQGLSHGLTLWGLAGVAISFTGFRNLSFALMALGAVGLCGGLVEDALNISQLGNGWEKDSKDAATRIALMTLFYLRFDKLS